MRKHYEVHIDSNNASLLRFMKALIKYDVSLNSSYRLINLFGRGATLFLSMTMEENDVKNFKQEVKPQHINEQHTVSVS